MSENSGMAVAEGAARLPSVLPTRIDPVIAAGGQPSAGTILVLIALFLLPISLIPSGRGIFFGLPLLPSVWWKTNLIVLFAMAVVTRRIFGGFSRRQSRSTMRWFLLPMLGLGLWQALSITWTDRDSFMRGYSLLQSLAMCAAVVSGVLLSSGLPYATRMRLGRGVTMLLAFVIAVYMGLSFVFPSWRPSSAWIDRTNDALGFMRVFGPLGKATTLNFILVPVLGFCIGMIRVPGRSKPFWKWTSLFFFAAVISTGSRGGILTLATFGLIITLLLRLRAALLLVSVGIGLGGVLLITGVPERFRNLEDGARAETYATAWRAFTANPRNALVGTGHGALYTALHDGTVRKRDGKARWHLLTTTTEFGFTLRSSHTALLRTLAETGIVGFAMLACPLIWMLKRLMFLRNRVGRDPYGIQAMYILAGCAATIPYMAFDEFFVTAHWIVFLWTLFVIIGAESAAEADALRGTALRESRIAAATHDRAV